MGRCLFLTLHPLGRMEGNIRYNLHLGLLCPSGRSCLTGLDDNEGGLYGWTVIVLERAMLLFSLRIESGKKWQYFYVCISNIGEAFAIYLVNINMGKRVLFSCKKVKSNSKHSEKKKQEPFFENTPFVIRIKSKRVASVASLSTDATRMPSSGSRQSTSSGRMFNNQQEEEEYKEMKRRRKGKSRRSQSVSSLRTDKV